MQLVSEEETCTEALLAAGAEVKHTALHMKGEVPEAPGMRGADA
jgi:hypothetical protein